MAIVIEMNNLNIINIVDNEENRYEEESLQDVMRYTYTKLLVIDLFKLYNISTWLLYLYIFNICTTFKIKIVFKDTVVEALIYYIIPK
jgi:hypothetical protein